MLTWPLFIRRLIARFRRGLPPSAPVRAKGGLEHLQSRLAHQQAQLKKWDARLKFGTFGDPDGANFMSRVEIKKMRDDVNDRISDWEDLIIEEELRLEEVARGR